MAARRLGELLVAKGKLTNDQLQKALQAQMIWGGHLGTNLIELGYINEDELGQVLAEAHAVQYAPYRILQEIPSSVLTSIPRGLVEKYKIVPFRFDGKKLHLVMLQPQDLTALDEVSFATGFQLIPYVTPEIRLFQVLEKYYNIPRARRYITLTREMSLRGKPSGAPPGSGADAEEAPPPPGGGRESSAPASPADARTGAGGSADEELDAYDASPATDWVPRDDSKRRRGMPPPSRPPSAPASKELVPEPLTGQDAEPRQDPGLDKLLKARSLDEICRTVVEEAAGTFRRCAVFARNGDALVSVTGLAASSSSWSIDGLALPFDLAAVEALFADGRTYYIGPPPGGSEERSFYESLGGAPPPNAFLSPIRLNDRIALIFYGDQVDEEVRPGEVVGILSMVQQASLALDLLSLRRKDSPE
jgi:hypothetical protein